MIDRRNRGDGYRAKLKRKRKNYMYAFSQHKPGEISLPIRTGVDNALSRLNYEVSCAKDAVKAIIKLRK